MFCCCRSSDEHTHLEAEEHVRYSTFAEVTSAQPLPTTTSTAAPPVVTARTTANPPLSRIDRTKLDSYAKQVAVEPKVRQKLSRLILQQLVDLPRAITTYSFSMHPLDRFPEFLFATPL
jgi:hypothetical protein